MAAIDVSALSAPELFGLFRTTVTELRSRGLVRSENVAGDYAEHLVMVALDGALVPLSEKSWDVLGRNGERVQVKARVVSDPMKRGQRQLSVFRSFDFDALVVVLLSDTDYRVVRAVMLPPDVVQILANRREHVAGSVLIANDAVLNHERAIDVTDDLVAAAHTLTPL
jgi:hypothetical protein